MQSGNLRHGLRNIFRPHMKSTSSLQWADVSCGRRVFAFPLSVTSHSWQERNKVDQCVWAEVTPGMQIKEGGSMLTDGNEQREQRADWIKSVVSHILFVLSEFGTQKVVLTDSRTWSSCLTASLFIFVWYHAGCCACFCWWDVLPVCTVCVRVYIPSLSVSTGKMTAQKTVHVLGSESGAAPAGPQKHLCQSGSGVSGTNTADGGSQENTDGSDGSNGS